MSGCAVVFGLLAGLLLLLPGLCVLLMRPDFWMAAVAILLVGSAVIIWALSRRRRE